MASQQLPFTLTLQSDLRLLAVLRTFIQSICEVAGFSEEDAHAIVLASHEAASNIIRHAHHDRPQAQYQVECYLTAQEIEICFLDEGEPFDLAAVPDLDPAEMRIGGRGVFLMRCLMDELTCEPREERGNILRMVKRCPPGSRVADAG